MTDVKKEQLEVFRTCPPKLGVNKLYCVPPSYEVLFLLNLFIFFYYLNLLI